ncbi:hypothetical protein JTL83_06840 [Pseudomonas aeruginosa]|nr:hypothetical protein [Pseudomonas aeruginosa]
MSTIRIAAIGVALYFVAAIVTFGHAHNWYSNHDLCEDRVFCASPVEVAAFSSMFWPFYWSMTAWRVGQ